jgi:Phospholipase_D-nuclease N-terminal/Short C-terminal domain
MPIAADYPFMDIVWTMIIFFFWVLWIWTLVMILSDVFRRDDFSGWAKAAWTLFIVVLPLLGVLIYLGVHGSDMGERRNRDMQAMLDRANVQSGGSVPAQGNGAAAEIAKAKSLLDSGAIDQAEYAKLKSRVLH